MGKPTWNDFKEARPAELMKTYKMTPRELENAHRNHLDGGNATEKRAEYDQLYRKNRSDV